MTVADLPHFHAFLNVISLTLITLAFMAIKSGNKQRHIKLMVAALGVSAVFLASYLVYHYNIGHTPFAGEGAVRYVYFTLLIVHILFAVISLAMIIMTVLRAYKKNFEGPKGHKAIAVYTFPVWFFVCASGVVVYVMAFHIYGVNFS